MKLLWIYQKSVRIMSRKCNKSSLDISTDYKVFANNQEFEYNSNDFENEKKDGSSFSAVGHYSF